MKKLGLDVGSTTLKAVLTDEKNDVVFAVYKRHFSKISDTVLEILRQIDQKYPQLKVSVTLSGSAGLGVADALDLPFVQEVYAEKSAIEALCPNADVAIELGGEDAKILFLSGGFEMRMNGSCAGGTGAFIDQMATLMQLDADNLNQLAKNHQKVHTIASRCGVFAKSDVQPLLNQGARQEDVAAGIFYAVANQTVGGLAQGRKIEGNVLYLGGPLTFMSELRAAFDNVLKVKGVCPQNSLYFVAIGAANGFCGKPTTVKELIDAFKNCKKFGEYDSCPPLFATQKDYDDFLARHLDTAGATALLSTLPQGELCLGVDAGSTTIKILLVDGDGNIFEPYYADNCGKPIKAILEYLKNLYAKYPQIKIATSAVTGYGEEMIKQAFNVDFGLVETQAHYIAAKKLRPDADFIIDIGGQDIKCFKIRNGLIEHLFLNEACSSGCGSFLQTFASSLGYDVKSFAKLGVFASAPVNLGTRCTVFMNSSVKQAQKDGATVQNISAGLSVSVVKNALYKVIRCANTEDLGKNIVVLGGTFLNDCVLRAFEREIGREVIRPAYPALTGAYGAALFAAQHADIAKRKLLDKKQLDEFKHESANVRCNGCGNNCLLTVNTFSCGGKFVAGNRCSRPLQTKNDEQPRNLYDFKLGLLAKYQNDKKIDGKINVGLPLGLNMYELLPFWHAFFTSLGINVMTSPPTTRKTYLKGQFTVPSDTVCYPAKLMHGHIEVLLSLAPDAIFYPDMTYNVDEKTGVDHYNCPVVAYYPQVLGLNVAALKNVIYIDDFLSLSNRRVFAKRMEKILKKYFPSTQFCRKNIDTAVKNAYNEYYSYLKKIEYKAQEYVEYARKNKKPVIVLAGRPYHVDAEINHGIDKLITRLGAVVISEDGLKRLDKPIFVNVRNQWTYHARLYNAAKYVANAPKDLNINLVQLVSFGCGVDAITADEVRSIVEKSGRLYSQLKIDEISNTGAVTIRLRSLMSIISDKNR